MQIGKLDRRITLLARNQTRDSFGDAVEQFTPFADVWAQVIPDRGSEMMRNGDVQRQAIATVTFRVRWRADLKREIRIAWAGAIYDVTNVVELGRRAGADLQAVASVS